MRIDARLLPTLAVALPHVRHAPPQLNLFGDLFNEQLKPQKPYWAALADRREAFTEKTM